MFFSLFLEQITNKSSGLPERKEIFLEDTDPVWLEIRHLHIAEVCLLDLCFITNSSATSLIL